MLCRGAAVRGTRFRGNGTRQRPSDTAGTATQHILLYLGLNIVKYPKFLKLPRIHAVTALFTVNISQKFYFSQKTFITHLEEEEEFYKLLPANKADRVSKLVSAANKAMHAMSCRCAFLHISDPKQRCKLIDSLVLPILSYASEVWAVDKKVGESAEQLHWQFLKHVLGVRGSTAILIVLLSLAAILYVFTGGSRFFDTTTTSTICLMMNASFSVLL